jgi:hypothetical protein
MKGFGREMGWLVRILCQQGDCIAADVVLDLLEKTGKAMDTIFYPEWLDNRMVR